MVKASKKGSKMEYGQFNLKANLKRASSLHVSIPVNKKISQKIR